MHRYKRSRELSLRKKSKLGLHLERRARQLRNRHHLIIHAGLHKTGSTSLQTSLNKSGLLLPTRRSDFRSEVPLAEKLKIAKSRGFIVSSEHFLGEMLGFYSQAEARVSWLTKLFDSFSLVVYLRPHLEWHESAFSQLIQQGTVMTEEAYLHTVSQSPSADFRNLARLICSVNKERSAGWVRYSSDVVGDFSRILGYQLPMVENRNASLHPLALEAIRRLRDGREFSQSELRRGLASWRPEKWDSFSVFSAETQSHFLAKNEEWMEVAEIISTVQEVPQGWTEAFPTSIKPSVQEAFTEDHLSSALEKLRDTIQERPQV